MSGAPIASAVVLLTRQAVCARVSLSKTKVYDLIRDGRFPKAHEVEPGIRRWRVEEVDAWINAKAPLSENGTCRIVQRSAA